ncbi:hypothetical protein [Thioalkalivibrio sp. ALE16]|uniref:hypothetical protein n=1 Tax=Thioalkalivibrio sp. ALE16 TaxID=1158172 RepID=UPI0012DFA649|nr:hypothetical protein [Thioalkalivibrio sp. ALE16]
MKVHQRRNVVLGVLFGAMGIVMTGGAATVAAMSVITPPETNADRAQQACEEQAKALKFSVHKTQKDLYLEASDNESPMVYVARLSVLQGFCSAHQLQSMCAGEKCGDRGFEARLSQVKDSE